MDDDSSASAASSPSSPSPVKRRRGGGRGRGRGGAAATATARLFGAKDAATDAAAAIAGAAADGGDAAAVTAGAGGAGAGSVTLMLFDEVDVLPDEDRGFMSALVSIIQRSKRPIVLTAGRGQLPPALRALGLQELHFQPAPEEQLLRTVVMACAAASRPEQGLRRPPLPHQPQPQRHSAAAAVGPGGSAEAVDAAAAAGGGGSSLLRDHGGRQRQQQQQPVLPSLLRLVRSCRGDLRHALLEAQFWLGAAATTTAGSSSSSSSSGGGGGGGGGGGSGGSGCVVGGMEVCPQMLGCGAEALERMGDAGGGSMMNDGGEDDGGPLYAAWRAVEALAAGAAGATAAAAAATAIAAEGGTRVVEPSGGGGEPSQYSFGAVLPRLGLGWLPKPSSRMAVVAAGAAGQLPLPPPEGLTALTPAARQLQWRHYEEECTRLREQQLAARWRELEVIRAAARAANRRVRGSAGPTGEAFAGEAGGAAGPSGEEDEGEGSGGDNDAAAVAPADEEEAPGSDSVEAAGAPHQERGETAAAAVVNGDGELPLPRGLSTAAGSDRSTEQEQQKEQQEGVMQPQRQQQGSGDAAGGTEAGAVAEPAAREGQAQQQQQQLPQKRRASEDADAGAGADAGEAATGADVGAGGGAKRSRLSRSRPPSGSATPAACSPAAPDGHAAAAAAAAVAAAASAMAGVNPGSARDHWVVSGGEAKAAVSALQEREPTRDCAAMMDVAAPPAANQGDAPSASEADANSPDPLHAPPPLLAWLLPPAPPPLPRNPKALAALAAADSAVPPQPAVLPDGGVDTPSGPLQAAVHACRTQAALAEMYGMLSDLDILAMPRDAYAPVSGPCPVQHQAAYASARPISLGTNMTLEPPLMDLYGSVDTGTAWVLADAVRVQEDMPGRLLSVLAAEAESAGLGAGEPAGPTGRCCAAEAAAAAARLATAVAAPGLLQHPHLQEPASQQQHQQQQQRRPGLFPAAGSCSPWQLAALHGALQATAPGWCCAGGRGAAMDRLGALASICRSEAARQQRETRRARWVRRAPTFCHYLPAMDASRLAALQQLTVFGAQAAPGAEAGGEEAQEVGGSAAGGGAGGRPRRRGW